MEHLTPCTWQWPQTSQIGSRSRLVAIPRAGPPAGDQDELCASCGLWVSTCDCEAESGGESDGEAEDEPGVEVLGPAKFVGARWAWRPDAELAPGQPPCAA